MPDGINKSNGKKYFFLGAEIPKKKHQKTNKFQISTSKIQFFTLNALHLACGQLAGTKMRCIWLADGWREQKCAVFRLPTVSGNENALHLGCRQLAGTKMHCIWLADGLRDIKNCSILLPARSLRIKTVVFYVRHTR